MVGKSHTNLTFIEDFKVLTVVCDGCGETVPAEGCNTHLPDSGLCFPFREMGYYGGFTDNLPWEPVEKNEMFLLCHACVVKFFDALPALANKIFAQYGGAIHHPTINSDGTPCCRFCWIPEVEQNKGEI